MISILISNYNYDCSRLVTDIDNQCRALLSEGTVPEFAYEILVGDDASTHTEDLKKVKDTTEGIGQTFIGLAENRGSAAMRNLLAERAKYDYLIYIDSDAQVCTSDFIARYVASRNKADVVCGTLRNPSGPCPKGCELRYTYEKKAEKSRREKIKGISPYTGLTFFNTLIRKDIIRRIPFDSRCTQYGYEDALMGIELQQKGCSILHIDNPLIHLGIDSNESFLRKTETSLHTLLHLGNPMQLHAGASRMAHRLQRFRLDALFRFLFHMFGNPMRRNLLGRHPNLLVFQLYKLGYYMMLEHGTKGRNQACSE